MNSIIKFHSEPFINALKAFFEELKVPADYLADEPASPKDILGEKYKATNEAHKLMDDVYALGMVNDGIFEGKETFRDLAQVKKLKVDYDGLLLFGVTLTRRADNLPIARSHLAEITRVFNRAFPYTPVTIVFKYGDFISLANSERIKYKQEWREGEKTGKVTILRDIHTQAAHAGHKRILNELRKPVEAASYKELHQHWLKVLDVNILNKKFFQDLANWYFWAMEHVSFPDDLEKKKEVRNATGLIRLITRIIFIWFIKEKSLVPDVLFNEAYLDGILKDFNKNKKSKNYYLAILQNLFFGTLNQKMDERKFVREGNININKAEFGVKNLFRYADLFRIAEKEVVRLFKDVPFLNGGLFDCLDKPDEEGKSVLYADGFSRNPKKQAHVPDYIFFGEEREIDLNDTYATKNKTYKSKGLIKLLESYKFTVAENTPDEEEVALDPELLGRVFENLLASYNPETQTTARKQTGSFYTPREIVNYMADESLLEYLKQNAKNKSKDFETRLRKLISYSETENPFNETETKALIEGINNCKILDPACGSGAYPMGILHKMVHLLQKLDPENTHWKALQLKKAEGGKLSAKEVKDVFKNNPGDYGRKLYLIENCIYGIDIQPIAVQISKLRFFISLIIDQNKQPSKENLGIRSLPNLETKFVAANTLIALDKPAQTFLRNLKIEAKETERKELRHKYFTANTRKQKQQCQKQDKKLRQEIAKMLESDGWQTATAKQIAAFDPYDQNSSSPWFDPEWMFGLTTGFDIVIGNPPYGAGLSVEQLMYFRVNYQLKTSETAILFIEKGFSLLKTKGFQSYIIPKSFIFASNYEQARDFVVNDLKYLVDCGKSFENVKLEACVLGLKKKSKSNLYKSLKLNSDLLVEPSSIIDKSLKTKFGFLPNGLSEDEINLGIKILDKCLLLASISKNSRGGIPQSKIETKGEFPIIGGKEISKYGIRGVKGYINDSSLITGKSKIHPNSILVQNIVAHLTQPYEHLKIIAAIPDKTGYLIVDTINQITITNTEISQHYIWSLLNSKLVNWYCYLFILAKAIRTIHFDNSFTSRIPIIEISKNGQKPFIFLVDYILLLKKGKQDVAFFERLIDAMVYELYLPEEIKSGGAEVLKYLSHLPELKEGQEEENLETIEEVYKELSDPKHPISDALLKLLTIEEVNIIEGRKQSG